MLKITNVTPSQGANYFKQENYYSKEEAQEQSKWFGQGAEALDLSGTVDGEQFKNLLEGCSPDGKKPLSGKKINLENRRAGFDLTFSAPKSFSLAALMGEAKELEQAHRNAVERTLKVVEQQHAQARVWDGKERQKINTGNLIVAQFHHTTSREKDPQLHTHCVVLNCTQLEDGKWRALTNEELYNNEMLLGAIYRNELASEARKLGYFIETRSDGLFEIKGYSETQLEWFSKRRQQILELVGEHATAKERQWAALQTRAAKGKELPREEQLGWWQAQDEAFNLQIQHPVPEVNIQPISDNDAISDNGAAAAVTAAIEHCSEKTVAFKRKALDQFIFSEIKSFSYAELESAIANDPELMATFNRQRFTTQAAVNRELETIRLMQQGKDTVDSIVGSETVKLRLENKTLTQGQQDAIALATTTTDGFIAWQGVAGAGKTYALNEFKVIAAEQGYTIKGFAPSSEAANVLGEEVGIETNTVASLLLSKQPEDIEDKQIWIVDEAGLLSAKDAHDLLKLATNQKARVILVGDTKQLSAVEAGNPFKSLQSAGISTAYLNQSLRQRVKDLQQSVDLVAEGKIDQGMERLDAANRIAVIPDVEERLIQLVQDYMALSPEERDKTLVLAGTNSDRQLIIDSIRQELKTEGVLGQAATLTQLKAKDLSQVQTRYSHHYAVGDVVVPTREYKRLGLTKFQPYTVEALEKNSLTLKATDGTLCTVDPMAFRKTVYEQQPIEIAVGDALKWKRNDREIGRRNGQQFVVTAISANHAQIKYANGKTDEVDLNQLQHLDYALVSTTYSSQGKTANRVLIAADKTMGKESFYVAVSRAKYDLKIYAEDKSNLLKLARKSKAKEIAIELIGSKPVAKKAAATEQSIPTTQLLITNEEITHERTYEPARPTADTEQFKPGDGDAIGRSVNKRLNTHSRKARPNRSVPAQLHESRPRGMATTVRQLAGVVKQPTPRKPRVPGRSKSTNHPSRRPDWGHYERPSTNSKLGAEIRQPDPRLQQLSHRTDFLVEHLESSDRVNAGIENAGTTTAKTGKYPRQADRQLEPELPTTSQPETGHSQFEFELQQISHDINALVKRLEPSSRLDGKSETGAGEQSSSSTTNPSTNRQPSTELRQFAENVNTFVQHVSSASRANAASPYQAERLTDLSSGLQPVNDDQNSNQEQEQISYDIGQQQLSPEWTADEQHSIDQLHSPLDQENWAAREQQQPVEHEDRTIGEQLQPIERTNSTARNYPNREFERIDNQLPELLETISRYLELQGVEQLGNHIAELNRSLNDGWLRGQGTTLFSNRNDGQDAAITDRTTSHGSIGGQDGNDQRTNRQLLNAIASSTAPWAIASNAALDAIASHVEQTTVESGITQPIANLTERIAQPPAGLSDVMMQLDAVISDRLQKFDALKTNLEKERSDRATVALSNYVDSSSVESALDEKVSSLVEQFSQYRQQLATDKNNSSLNLLLNRLESISNSKQEAKLPTKDLQEAQAQADTETRSHSSSANESSSDWLPIRDEQQWAQVRQYLVEQRCLPTQLVDKLATAGKVYADSSGNAVFLHTANQRRINGATIFDIKSKGLNCQLALGADNGVGYFQFSQGKGKLSRVFLTDSPLEAMSLAALEQDRSENRTLYIDVNDRQDNPQLQGLIDDGVGIEVAFGAEGASETKARQIVNSFPAVIRSKPAGAKSWNEQLRSKSDKSKHSKPHEKARLLPTLRSAQSHPQKFDPNQNTQRFDPNQQILKAIQVDRDKYKSACQSDLKTAISGLVAGRTLEQISQDIASSSSLVKHWETSEGPSTQAIAKTIKYVEQLCEKAQTSPEYYRKFYHKYLQEAQKNNTYLSRTELDKAVASVALRSHPEESVRSMLKYSLAAQVGDDGYVEQTLAVVRQQAQDAQSPPQKTRPSQKTPEVEYGD
jgi:conjugative relaxase-like TrwC/TraI family protein